MAELILGIETSCDDTAVAVVDEGGNVLSSVIASQLITHAEFGGVFPEFAAREHIANILPVIHEALLEANIQPSDLKAIGVTRGPGLIGSLLVGLHTATALGIGWNKPVIGINHLRGHLRSADLEERRVIYPATILMVSGGHSLLAYMKNETDITMLGSTRDDSVGEVFDKVGRMLGLSYPGGPAIDRLATLGQPNIPFPRPMLRNDYEFSFSGLKSAVSRYLAAHPDAVPADVAASFVQAVMEVLIKKSRWALKQNPSKSFVIVGGVAANSQLRAEAAKLCKGLGVPLSLPPLRWSTDNGAMIALATFDYLKSGIHKPPIPQLQLSINEF